MNRLGPDQNGNHGSGDQAKGSMPHRSQDGRDRSRMAGERHERATIVREDVVEQPFEPGFLRRIGLAHVGRPERVNFGETGLDHEAGVSAVNVRFAAAAVARMDANCFAEELKQTGEPSPPSETGARKPCSREKRGAYLFHFGNEGVTARELQSGKRHIGRGQTPIQWTGVVRFGGGDFLGRDRLGPERVGLLGLLDAFLRQMSVSPVGGGVSILLGPIALPHHQLPCSSDLGLDE